MFEDLTPGEIWKIQDDIIFNRISFYEGETVIIFQKNKNGYPRYLKVGDVGIVKSVEPHHVIVDFNPTYGKWIDYSKLINTKVKLPKKLLIEKVYLRDLKLRKLLE